MEHPIVDPFNPFYCPAVPASRFLLDLRQAFLPGNLNSKPRMNRGPDSLSFVTAFAKMLDPVLPSADGDSLVQHFQYDSENDWIVGVNVGGRRRGRKAANVITARWPTKTKGPSKIGLGSDALDLPLDDSPSADVEQFTFSGFPPKFQSTVIPQQRRATNKRKREPSPLPLSSPSPNSKSNSNLDSDSDSSSSDLGEPPLKYGKSNLLVSDESSFELDVRRERVDFDASGSPTLLSTGLNSKENLQDLNPLIADVLLGTVIGNVLDFLPGIRLEERLARIPDLSVQKVADFLAEHGYMNHAVLTVFRRTGITRLCLSPSLCDEDGLNICGEEVIKALGTPGCFEQLEFLDFTRSVVQDFNLVHIHHLPNLAVLNLSNTCIGNEAIYLLVPLKRTLKRLYLSVNPDITSESVPAMLLLENLEFLSIHDTGVDMVGLRLIAKTIYEETRTIDIEIPYTCENYIDNLHTMYLVDIQPPLIADPTVCPVLSSAVLKQNLMAHAEKNPGIATSGSKAELVARLQDILRRREGDLVVAQMLLGP